MNMFENTKKQSEYDTYESLLGPLISSVEAHLTSFKEIEDGNLIQLGLIQSAVDANAHLGPMLYLPFPLVCSEMYFSTTLTSKDDFGSLINNDLFPAKLFNGDVPCFIEDSAIQNLVEIRNLESNVYIISGHVDPRGSVFYIFIPELTKMEQATVQNNSPHNINVPPLNIGGLLEVHLDPK